MKAAAIYARVSSEQQKEENTIASQTAALIEFAREQGYGVPDEWVVEDEGFSGASLLRPGLERLRDLAVAPLAGEQRGEPLRAAARHADVQQMAGVGVGNRVQVREAGQPPSVAAQNVLYPGVSRGR